MTTQRAILIAFGWLALLVVWGILSGCAMVIPACPNGLMYRAGQCEGIGDGTTYRRNVEPLAAINWNGNV